FAGVYGEFHQHTVAARSALAGALLNAARFDDCLAVLMDELTRLDATPDAPGDRRLAVLRAIGVLYDRWNAAEPGKGYDAKASEWKANERKAISAEGPATPAT
ncbi:MAG TPA: hypothetical protein VK176_16710, partial [Phycisphaerales bacterium]|nr:hypothetical protein [Phycisphaerales bacterium]